MAGEGGDGGDWNEAHSRCELDAREKQSGNGRAGNGKAGVARENKSERTHASERTRVGPSTHRRAWEGNASCGGTRTGHGSSGARHGRGERAARTGNTC